MLNVISYLIRKRGRNDRTIIDLELPSVALDSGKPEWTVGEANKLTDAILAKIRAAFPKEERIPKNRIMGKAFFLGWNAYHAELLKRLEG